MRLVRGPRSTRRLAREARAFEEVANDKGLETALGGARGDSHATNPGSMRCWTKHARHLAASRQAALPDLARDASERYGGAFGTRGGSCCFFVPRSNGTGRHRNYPMQRMEELRTFLRTCCLTSRRPPEWGARLALWPGFSRAERAKLVGGRDSHGLPQGRRPVRLTIARSPASIARSRAGSTRGGVSGGARADPHLPDGAHGMKDAKAPKKCPCDASRSVELRDGARACACPLSCPDRSRRRKHRLRESASHRARPSGYGQDRNGATGPCEFPASHACPRLLGFGEEQEVHVAGFERREIQCHTDSGVGNGWSDVGALTSPVVPASFVDTAWRGGAASSLRQRHGAREEIVDGDEKTRQWLRPSSAGKGEFPALQRRGAGFPRAAGGSRLRLTNGAVADDAAPVSRRGGNVRRRTWP